MKKGAILSLITIAWFCFGQNTSYNALSLRSGCRLLSNPGAYTPTRNTTARIDEWSAEAIIDENGSNGWCSSQYKTSSLVFLFELSEVHDVERLDFDNSCQQQYSGICAKDVLVEASLVSSVEGFTTVGKFTLEQYKKNSFTINTLKTRWLRVTIINNYGNREWTELMEIAAIGKFSNYELSASPNIVGEWSSNWDWVSMKMNDNGYIYGCYKYNNGTLSAGTVNRRVFEFEWEEKIVKTHGWATLVINEEENRVTGIWGFNNNRNSFGFWDFTYKTETAHSCWNDADMAALKPTKYQIPIKKKEFPLPEPQIPSARTLILKIVDADNQSPLSANIKYNDQAGKTVSLSQVSEKSIPITTSTNFSVEIGKEGYISATEMITDTAKTVVKTILLHRLNVGKAIVMKNVLFQRGTTILLESSKPDLLNVINLLKENPKVELEIAGHTDNVGDADMNLELSEKRAATIKKYLVDNGIASKRVTSKGYGKTKPIADNSKEETRKLNRRVEYIITKI